MSRIKIGWASQDVSAKTPVNIPGQFHMRISQGVLDPVTATALVLENDGDAVCFVSMDAVCVEGELVPEVRDLAAKLVPELDPEKIVLNATHTHDGPGHNSATLDFAKTTPAGPIPTTMKIADSNAYRHKLARTIAEMVREAWEGRAPGGIAYGYGYAVVAQILAETLKKEARPANGPAGNYGVEVVNLWDDAKQQTLPLIPGHYVLSFETDDAPDGKAVFEIYGDHPSHPVTKRKAFVKKLTVAVTPGKRAFAVVPVTSPESVGRETCRIRNANCTLKKIKIEKMRPDGRPTPYQTGRVIDTSVTPYLGELLVQVP